MDWVLFHVEQNFHYIWIRYQRALAQRNAALKSWVGEKSISTWDDELALHGDTIQEMRERAAKEMNDRFKVSCRALLPDIGDAELFLQHGWKNEGGLRSALQANIKTDVKQGFTQSGPHRNDLVFKINEINNKFELSHGQKKLLFVALKIAQVELLYSVCGIECSLLIDDLSAELDKTSQKRVMTHLSALPGQIFATSLDNDPWAREWQEFGAFHVKHGSVETMAKC